MGIDAARIKAIVFDVDGTLYRQGPLRRAMAMRLLWSHAMRPAHGWRTMRALSAYRKAQERLRDGSVSADLAEAQLRLACEATSIDRRFVSECVARWMEQEPLSLLSDFVWPGLTAFLEACKARGIRLGVLSDYPAEAKLDALGLGGVFDVVLCAQAPDIGVFKPHPRGLEVTLARLGATPAETLYVGDRADSDAPAAAAAGVACAILTRPSPANPSRTWTEVAHYTDLHSLLFREISQGGGEAGRI
jgi:HAD superfamily hydrolase (TIGR01509 family)